MNLKIRTISRKLITPTTVIFPVHRLFTNMSTARIRVSGDLPKLGHATLEELSAGLGAQQFTSVQLVAAYKRRIAEVNDEFNAVLEANPDAEKIAAELDKERQEKKTRGPLHGIPILLKDNIFTDDRMSTSAGSYALLGSRAPREATFAQKLRQSGAILLGKVNLSEWANFRSGPNNGSNSWSARGGQTYSVFHPGAEAHGSSSGSAVSTVLGLAFAAIDRSIVAPAQRSSLVGVAPTVGLVARDGVIPLSNRQDTIGPIGRTVKSAAHLLTAMSGRSLYDDATKSIPFESIPDYAHACQGSRLDGLRIGVPRDIVTDTDKIFIKEFKQALSLLESAGATIVHDVKFAGAKEWNEWDDGEKRACLQAEFKHSIEGWLKELVENPRKIHSLSDIIAFTKSDPRECYPARDIRRWEWSDGGFGYGSKEYSEVLRKMYRLCGKEGITGAVDEYSLDLMVYPTAFDPPSTFVARLGLPAITVPFGFYAGDTKPTCHRGDIVDVAPNVPFGITFAGKAYTEEVLFRAAHVYEAILNVQGRIQPFKVPTTELADVVNTKLF